MAEGLLSRKILGQMQLTTALQDIYVASSVPPNFKALIGAIWIANTDGTAHTVTLYLGPPGALTVANALMENVALIANTTYVVLGSEWDLTLDAGYHIQAAADANSVITVTVMGAEVP